MPFRAPFRDRADAGRRLAARLRHLTGHDVVVVGLPRGGVPVAAEVADALDAPLDAVVVRKLGVPWQPELAMGAVGEDGVTVLDARVLGATGLTEPDVELVASRERAEVARRLERLRAGRPRVPLAGRTVVVVDDGVATGSTARAACAVVRALGAAHVVLAVPVAPLGWEERFRGEGPAGATGADADELVAVETPADLESIGRYYDDFTQVPDADVVAALDRAARRVHASGTGPARAATTREHLFVPTDGVTLEGELTVPAGALGLVVFAHGSGSSRHSPRNRHVARALEAAGLATLLVDLLSPGEEQDRSLVFDVPLLADRLVAATRRLGRHPGANGLPVGWFGASTGAAAALWAAAEEESPVRAIVSRGGRPDLAARRLHRVAAPTLLVVGGADEVVLGLNERARAMLRCPNDLVVVPRAGHLFAEPGAIDVVAGLACDWFTTHLGGARGPVERRTLGS
ncbi:phosphoribosyltransferase family protein [Actinotalea sp. AC32]|nr:phosphoribosyltransferase family protein [Actinotalea sp. AC32]